MTGYRPYGYQKSQYCALKLDFGPDCLIQNIQFKYEQLLPIRFAVSSMLSNRFCSSLTRLQMHLYCSYVYSEYGLTVELGAVNNAALCSAVPVVLRNSSAAFLVSVISFISLLTAASLDFCFLLFTCLPAIPVHTSSAIVVSPAGT